MGMFTSLPSPLYFQPFVLPPLYSFLYSHVCLWNILKKKPLLSQSHHQLVAGGVPGEHWVASVASYPNTDLVVSGGCGPITVGVALGGLLSQY